MDQWKECKIKYKEQDDPLCPQFWCLTHETWCFSECPEDIQRRLAESKMEAIKEFVESISFEKLWEKRGKCTDPYHDERWCSTCDIYQSALDFFIQQLRHDAETK